VVVSIAQNLFNTVLSPRNSVLMFIFPSTFDIHYSIFAFSELLFRLDRGNKLNKPNPDKPVGVKRKPRFNGEPKKINHESTK